MQMLSMHRSPWRAQRGVTTLVVVLLLLVILTLVVLGSTSTALFEQKTTTNENRQKLATQSAEYAVNLSGEWLKMNMLAMASARVSEGGWLATGATNRWTRCDSVTVTNTHPCAAERVVARRNHLYFYNFADANTASDLDLPYSAMGGVLTDTGGSAGATFSVDTTVNALLCRLDTTVVDAVTGAKKPDCRVNPNSESETRVAVTLIANSRLDDAGENAQAQVKEIWASYASSLGSAAVPLIAAGNASGLGNGEIVAAPNGAGFGLPVSIWSPCPVDIEQENSPTYPPGCSAPANGVGSFSTCHLGEFLKSTPELDFKTTCAASNNACGCPSFNNNPTDFMSGHSNSEKRESVDILDQDNNVGKLPDIDFFPGGQRFDGTQLDDPNDSLDDSLFEWIFAQEVVAEGATSVPSNCGSGSENCALVALRDTLGATIVSNCNGFSTASSGIYYVTGDCDFPAQAKVGSPTSPAIVVVNGDAQGGQGVRVGGQLLMYGLLFIRSDDNSGYVTGNGNPEIYGSLVVEGDIRMTGSFRIVYDNSASGVPDDGLTPTTRFAKLPGSWLDNSRGF